MLRERARSFGYAFSGLWRLFREEANAKIHLFAAVVVMVGGAWCHLSRLEWALVAFAIGLVIAAEAFNTALERLADAVKPEKHPLVGAAKDIAAAAVLACAITAIAIGLFVFVPHLSAW